MTKTKIESGRFASAIGMAAAAASRDALSQFAVVTVSATKKWVAATGTDGVIQTSVRVGAETESDWSAAAPAALIAKFAAALPGGVCEITAAPSLLTLDCGGVRFQTATRAEVGAMSAPKGKAKVYLPEMTLREMLRKTKFAASTDQTRKKLMGVNVALAKDGTLSMTATDGRRLAHVEYGCGEPGDGGAEFDVTLPTRAVDALYALLSKNGSQDVTVAADASGMMFTGERWTVTCKVIDERYPNWKQVVPSDVPHVATIERKPFVEALERVAIASDSVLLTLAPGRAAFGANGGDRSAGAEIADCRIDDGAVYSGLFDPRLLLDALKALDEDAFTMSFNRETGGVPVVIKCSAPWFAVVMPLRKED